MSQPSVRVPVALAAATLLVSACSLVGRGDPPAADLTGSYAGVLRLEGEEMATTLVVRQDGGNVDADLDASTVGLAARGSGRMSGTVLTLEFEYGDDCEGTLELAGQALDGGQRLAGTVEARDCTGPATGSFSFSRR